MNLKAVYLAFGGGYIVHGSPDIHLHEIMRSVSYEHRVRSGGDTIVTIRRPNFFYHIVPTGDRFNKIY